MKTKTATLEKLKKTIENVTGSKVGNIDLNGNIRSQLSVDSVQFIQLFSAIEIEFGIELPLSIMNTETVAEFVTIIEDCVGTNAV